MKRFHYEITGITTGFSREQLKKWLETNIDGIDEIDIEVIEDE